MTPRERRLDAVILGCIRAGLITVRGRTIIITCAARAFINRFL